MLRCARRPRAPHYTASERDGETLWVVPWCGFALRWDRWSYAVRVGTCAHEAPSAPAVLALARAPRKGRAARARRRWLSPGPRALPRRRAPAGGLPHRVAHTKCGTARRSAAQGGPRGATAHKAAGRGAGDGAPLRGASTPLHRAIRRGVKGRRRLPFALAGIVQRGCILESHPVGAQRAPVVHDWGHGDHERAASRFCVTGRPAGVCNTLGNPRSHGAAEPREARPAGDGGWSLRGCLNPPGDFTADGMEAVDGR